MHGLGTHVAVIQNDEILLIQREDFEVWALPGGEIERGETPAQAAVREVYEETGLHVRLTRLVGMYTKPRWHTGVDSTTVVFAGEVIGGELAKSTSESLAVAFFKRDQLPKDTIWWTREQIKDAFNGFGGSVVTMQDAPWPQVTSRAALYRQRDESGLSRAEYFHSIFTEGNEVVEVEGKPSTCADQIH